MNGDGKGGLGLRSLVADRLDEIDARAINSLPLGTDSEGRDVVIRVGRFGPYLQRADETASLPEDLPPDELTMEKAEALLAAPSGDRLVGTDPASSKPVYVRNGRFGAYVQLGEAGKDADEKPKTASLLRSMSPENLTFEEALRLLSLPRLVGNDPNGKPILAQIGRYGAYVTREPDSRSLEQEEQVFTVTVDEALALFAQPKMRQRRAAAEPLKVLGDDPVSKKPMKVMQGRFGLYVTDGETNASLRREDSLETLSDDRAQELLQLRRERGPVEAKPGRGKAAAKAKPAGKAKPAKAKASANGSSAEGDGAPKKSAPAKPKKKKKPASKAKASAPKSNPGTKKPGTRGASSA
jgi:DNA topoisomerase-1